MARIGDDLLVVAIVALLVAAGLGALGRLRAARRASIVAALSSALAVGVLGSALLRSDFSLTYVADQSRRGASAPLRLAGLWGGPEGSLLLWGAMLAGWVAIGVAGRARSGATSDERRSQGASIALGALAAAVPLATCWWWADPFDRLAIPALDGGGLVPILDHPAMLVHPPLLYAALTALVVPYALVAGSAIVRSEQVAPSVVRRWLLTSWTGLAAALLLGAAWAYAELGWGGYWAWDPVESSALVPWLLITAWLHHEVRVGPTGGGRLGLALAVSPFVLTAAGTALTRSGALSSVHAFAESITVGRALGAGAALVLATAVAATVRAEAAAPSSVTSLRDWLLVIQVALLALAAGTVVLGTIWPLVAGDDVTTVDGSFYSGVLGPLLPLVVAGTGLALLPAGGRWRWAPGAVGTLVGAVACTGGPAVLVAAGAAGGGAIGCLVVAQRGPSPPHRATVVAHVGAIVLLVAIAASTTSQTSAVSVEPGASVRVAGWTVRNEGVEARTMRPGVDAVIADLVVSAPGAGAQHLSPRLDRHRTSGTLLAETAVRTTWREHVRIVLLDAADSGRVLLQVDVQPGVPWIWLGAVLIVAGGALAVRRRGDGATSPQSSSL